jgi:Resolvase, N terminal domain
MPPDLSLSQVKITPQHLERKAVISIRQSSPKQVREHLDSQLTQRTLIRRAEHLGWHPERIAVFDGDLGQSAAGMQERDDFKALAAEVALGHVGVVFGWQVSRLARNNAEWYQLLDLAALLGTLIGDTDGIYDPRLYNDRLLLGLKNPSLYNTSFTCNLPSLPSAAPAIHGSAGYSGRYGNQRPCLWHCGSLQY